jgi:MFS family permease
MVYTARLLEGIAYGAFTGTAAAFLLSHSPQEKMPSALKLSGMAVSAGFGLGSAITGLVIQYIHFKPLELPFWIPYSNACDRLGCV